MSVTANILSSSRFILENVQMGEFSVPGLVGIAILLMNPAVREYLKERRTLFLFISVFLLWILLIPWSILWIAIKGVDRSGPLWAAAPNFVVFFLWPVAGYQLIKKMARVRGWAIFYVLCNLPSWFFCFIGAGMAVGGDWV